MLLLAVSVAAIAFATASPAGAWSGKDRYCDSWNFALDPDCKSAKYDIAPTPTPTPPTGATSATGATGPTEPVFLGDTTWPAPPGGKYGVIRANGRTAYAPKNAPPAVKRMFRAANSLTQKPYVWGGGHLGWYARGYDCSGATSFVLRAGGFVAWPMVSGTLANWGVRGPGRWVQVYSNREHVYMVIAGLRFDTTPWYPGEKGPRWRATVRSTKGFALRHPVRY
jgi:cell wall-associated NlpC family hydrolase